MTLKRSEENRRNVGVPSHYVTNTRFTARVFKTQGRKVELQFRRRERRREGRGGSGVPYT